MGKFKNLKLDDKECKKLLLEQEKDVRLILHKNESLLLSLASKLYNDGFISNSEIKRIWKNAIVIKNGIQNI